MFTNLTMNKKARRKKKHHKTNKFTGGTNTGLSINHKNDPDNDDYTVGKLSSSRNDLLKVTREMFLQLIADQEVKVIRYGITLPEDLYLSLVVVSLFLEDSYMQVVTSNKNYTPQDFRLFNKIYRRYNSLLDSIKIIYICINTLYYIDNPLFITEIITKENCLGLSKHFTTYLNYRNDDNNNIFNKELDKFLGKIKLKYPEGEITPLKYIFDKKVTGNFICHEISNTLGIINECSRFKKHCYSLINDKFKIITKNKPNNTIVESHSPLIGDPIGEAIAEPIYEAMDEPIYEGIVESHSPPIGELKNQTKSPPTSLFRRLFSRKHSIRRGGKKRKPTKKRLYL